MNDFYTFIVISTINTKGNGGLYDNATRYQQTLKTLTSIRDKVPTAKIVILDNSSIPLSAEQTETVNGLVDLFIVFKNNIFTNFVNTVGSTAKGFGEAALMYEALGIIKQAGLVGKRVFKLSGRYNLADSFDIAEYDKPEYEGKYAARINEWDMTNDGWATRERVIYFETRLWSFCGSMLDEYKETLQRIFGLMMTKEPNYEKAHFALIPKDKLIDLKPIHVEGYPADDGVYKFE